MPTILHTIIGEKILNEKEEKHRALIVALALLFAVSMTACDAKNAAIETEASQETTEATVAEPVMITVEDLKLLADKGTLSRGCLFFIGKNKRYFTNPKGIWGFAK